MTKNKRHSLAVLALVAAMLLMTLSTALTSCRDDLAGDDNYSYTGIIPGQLSIASISTPEGSFIATSRSTHTRTNTEDEANPVAAGGDIGILPNTAIIGLVKEDQLKVEYSFTGSSGTFSTTYARKNDDRDDNWTLVNANGNTLKLRPNASNSSGESWENLYVKIQLTGTSPNPGTGSSIETDAACGMKYAATKNDTELKTALKSSSSVASRTYYDAMMATGSGNSTNSDDLLPGTLRIGSDPKATNATALGAITAHLAHAGALMRLKPADIHLTSLVHEGQLMKPNALTNIWASISTMKADGNSATDNFYVRFTKVEVSADEAGSGADNIYWQAIVPGKATVTGFVVQVTARAEGSHSDSSIYINLDLSNASSEALPDGKELTANLRYPLELSLKSTIMTMTFGANDGRPGWDNNEGEITDPNAYLKLLNPEAEGTEEDPYKYQVGTAQGLKDIADYINSRASSAYVPGTVKTKSNSDERGKWATHITLTQNIDLASLPRDNTGSNWTPLCDANGQSYNYYYTGIFDGGGYTISNLVIKRSGTIEQGFFRYIGATGVVKNLTLKGSVDGNNKTAGIASLNRGTIEGVTMNGTVKGRLQVGGIAGYNYGLITGCTTNGNVEYVAGAETYSGGITGMNDGGRVIECYNRAKVTGNYRTGGIAGQNQANSLIKGCKNEGTIDATNCAGGMTSFNYGIILACINSGTVNSTAENEKVYAGGMVGQNRANAVIVACYNKGYVNTHGALNRAAGITGWSDPGCYIWACYNIGELTAQLEKNIITDPLMPDHAEYHDRIYAIVGIDNAPNKKNGYDASGSNIKSCFWQWGHTSGSPTNRPQLSGIPYRADKDCYDFRVDDGPNVLVGWIDTGSSMDKPCYGMNTTIDEWNRTHAGNDPNNLNYCNYKYEINKYYDVEKGKLQSRYYSAPPLNLVKQK